uniref:Uncharacterized protein n=1 Tax=Rhizophora mucronata TaxID=61149 RepID=A0A2P2P484_RHIMU
MQNFCSPLKKPTTNSNLQ